MARNRTRIMLAFAVGLLVALITFGSSFNTLHAQDAVITLSSKGAEVSRKGTIVDWQADTLTIEISGREKSIKGNDIVRIQTDWSEQYRVGLELFEQRKFTEAIEPLVKASRTETRDWARTIILAKLTQCFGVQEDYANAASSFSQIITYDGQSRFTHLVPLPWDRAFIDTAMIERAKQWQQSSSETIRLMGASWLLGSPAREAATAELDELSRSRDPRIAHLASLQLWRGKSVSANASDLARLEKQIARMPVNIRGGAMFVRGEIELRLQQIDEASLSYLQIPILHPDNLRLSAIGLQKAATSLEKAGQSDEAKTLLRELVRDYPKTRFAAEANSRLQTNDQN